MRSKLLPIVLLWPPPLPSLHRDAKDHVTLTPVVNVFDPHVDLGGEYLQRKLTGKHVSKKIQGKLTWTRKLSSRGSLRNGGRRREVRVRRSLRRNKERERAHVSNILDC